MSGVWVIYSPSEAKALDDGFWCEHHQAWMDLCRATRFAEGEKQGVKLPASDARWMLEEEAEDIANHEELVVDGEVVMRGTGMVGVIYNNLIGANPVYDWLDYVAYIETLVGVPLRGSEVAYRSYGQVISRTPIPSSDPKAHAIQPVPA